MPMTQIEQLLAIEAIKRLKASYFRFVDTKDWEAFASLFAEDVLFDISSGHFDCILHSPREILEVVTPRLRDCVTVHHGHCPEITITSDTTAEGVWAMEDKLRWAEGSDSPIRALHGYGHYHETYRKIDGEWRIQSMKLTRLRLDTEPWEAAG